MLVYQIISPVLKVFAVIVAGFFLGKLKVKKINLFFDKSLKIILQFIVPLFIFTQILHARIKLNDFLVIGACSLVIFWGNVLIIKLYGFKAKIQTASFILPAIIMNTANIGFPVNILAYGENVLIYALIFNIFISIYGFTFGVSLITKENPLKSVFKLSYIYVVILTLILYLMGLRDTHFNPHFFKVIYYIGYVSIPFMLVSLGYDLSNIKVMLKKQVVFGALTRVAGGFILANIAVLIFVKDSDIAKVIITSGTMPSAVVSYLLVKNFKINPEDTASVVALTTAAAFFYLPFVIFFCKMF